MNKLIYVLPLVVVVLSGCLDPTEGVSVNSVPVKGSNNFKELCLNKVNYYFYYNGNRAGLAVKIDPVTLQPTNCELY